MRSHEHPKPQTTSPAKQIGPAPTAREIADAIDRQLVDGEVLYEPSREMFRGKPATVLARVAADPSIDIRRGLQGGGYVVEKIKVSYRMKAVLEVPEGTAKVAPLGGLADGVQALGNSGYSTWTWSVTPLKAEDFDLTLYLYAIVSLDGESSPHLLLTKEAKIRVRPSPLLSKVLAETGSFAGKVYDKMPEIIASGLGSGIASLMYFVWRSRRRKKHPPKAIIAGTGL